MLPRTFMLVFSTPSVATNSLIRVCSAICSVFGLFDFWRNFAHVEIEHALAVGRQFVDIRQPLHLHLPFIIASMRCTGGSTASGELILLPFASSIQLCAR